MIAGNIDVLRGQTGSYTLRFTVPKGFEHLEIVPSARYPAIDYTVGAKRFSDDGPHRVAW